MEHRGAIVMLGLGALVAACTAVGPDGPRGTEGPGADPATSVEEGPCAAETTEPLDASSSLHLLPGAPEPSYLSDPPTSGPHRSGPAPSGALANPIDRPTQVQVLEQGGVVIQHRDLDDASVSDLATLGGEQVVVAPNPGLPAPVVATAWLAKRSCRAVDLAALRQFIEEHRGVGPEH
ncbi:MAG: DUF3105 domain-containing protein [Actinobacteria bacterium]|nr:DUF3105 domain-containing protein [Actinomycetota bacterium]